MTVTKKGDVRVNFQEWAVTIKKAPRPSFEAAAIVQTHSFAEREGVACLPSVIE